MKNNRNRQIKRVAIIVYAALLAAMVGLLVWAGVRLRGVANTGVAPKSVVILAAAVLAIAAVAGLSLGLLWRRQR